MSWNGEDSLSRSQINNSTYSDNTFSYNSSALAFDFSIDAYTQEMLAYWGGDSTELATYLQNVSTDENYYVTSIDVYLTSYGSNYYQPLICISSVEPNSSSFAATGSNIGAFIDHAYAHNNGSTRMSLNTWYRCYAVYHWNGTTMTWHSGTLEYDSTTKTWSRFRALTSYTSSVGSLGGATAFQNLKYVSVMGKSTNQTFAVFSGEVKNLLIDNNNFLCEMAAEDLETISSGDTPTQLETYLSSLPLNIGF